MANSLRIQTNSPEETQGLGALIGRSAQAGDIYLLTGTLGAGKTCLSQGIARGLEVPENLRSPTFVLMTRHKGRLDLHHLDLYRIGDPWEVWDLGVDELLFGDGVCVVEWADKATELFPLESCWIDLQYSAEETQRTLTLSTASIRYETLLRTLAHAIPKASLQVNEDTKS